MAIQSARRDRCKRRGRTACRHGGGTSDNLGLDVLDVVNLRVGGFESPEPGSIAEPFTVLVQMQQEGLIRHLGISLDATPMAVALAWLLQRSSNILLIPGTSSVAHWRGASGTGLILSVGTHLQAEKGIAYRHLTPYGREP